MSTIRWVRKCSSSRFLLLISSAYKKARRRTLPQSVLLRCAANFGHEHNNGLQDIPRAGSPCGKGGYGCKEPMSQLHTCLEGKAILEIRYFLGGGGGISGGDHQVGFRGFSGRGFATRGCFLLWFPRSRVSGCCRLRDLDLGEWWWPWQ